MNRGRILATYQRHFYGFRNQPAAYLDLFLWPMVDMLVWGMVMVFIQRSADIPFPVAFLLGGVLLWTIMFRANTEVSLAYLADTSWTPNALNFLVSPLRPGEYLIGVGAWALSKIAFGSVVMAVLAWVLFHFSILWTGAALGVFVFALMLFGLAMAMIVIGLVTRFGHGADILAWGLAGIFTPLSAVWYPVDVMPEWARGMAMALPPAHIFEGMRTVLAGGALPWGSVIAALALDVVYLCAAFAFARAMFSTFSRRGFVTRYMN